MQQRSTYFHICPEPSDIKITMVIYRYWLWGHRLWMGYRYWLWGHRWVICWYAILSQSSLLYSWTECLLFCYFHSAFPIEIMIEMPMIMIMVFSATLNNISVISWRGKKHRTVAMLFWVYLAMSGILTINISGYRYWYIVYTQFRTKQFK